MGRLLSIIDCCAIMHNFLFQLGENARHRVPQGWYAEVAKDLDVNQHEEGHTDDGYDMLDNEFDQRASEFRYILNKYYPF